MCLLITIRSPDGSLILAANRDERYQRPTRQPFLWSGRPRVLAGKDELAGGAWLAVNEHGVVAAAANRPTAGGDDPLRPSRGRLPLLACEHAAASTAREALAAHLKTARYNGFNLLVADARAAFVIQAPGSPAEFQDVPVGVYVLGNDRWNDPSDGRVERAHRLLAQRKVSPDRPADEILPALARICRDHDVLPDGKSLCLHMDVAGTVSSTLLVLDSAGKLLHYLHAPSAPCACDYRELAPAF